MWTLCNQTFSVHRINLQERNDQFRFQFLSDTEPRQAYPAGAVVSVLVRNMPRASVIGRSSRRAVSPRRRLLIRVGARARAPQQLTVLGLVPSSRSVRGTRTYLQAAYAAALVHEYGNSRAGCLFAARIRNPSVQRFTCSD